MKLFLFIFSFFISILLQAQQRLGKFIVYGKENGLGQNAYHDVLESSDGYLWVASNNGIYKFDGKRFTQIINLYNDSNTPTDNNIVDFEEDRNGNVWMAGFVSGVSKYNLKTGKFRQYKRLSQDSTAGYATFCITLDEHGTVWIGTAGRGLARYLPEKDTFDFFYPDENKHTDGSAYGENWVSGIVQDEKDKDIFWLSCYDGVHSFNRKTKLFEYYPSLIKPVNSTYPVLSLLCIEQYGNYLYMGTWFEGLIVFDKTTKQFRRIKYDNPGRKPFHYGILDLQIGYDSVLYLAAMNDGLLAFNLKTEMIVPELRTSDIKLTNTEINIQRVSNTKHAGFFAGGNSSVYQLSKEQNRFVQYHDYANIPKTVKEASPAGLFNIVYNKNIKAYSAVFFNHPGMIMYDSSFDKKKMYLLDNENEWLEDIATDVNGKTWGISRYGSIYRHDPAKVGKVSKINIADSSYAFAKNIFFEEVENCDDGKFIWFVSRSAAFLYDVDKGAATRFDFPINEIKKYSKRGIYFFSARADSKNNLWIASNAGLLKLEAGNGKVHYFYGKLNDKTPLAATSYKSIAIDKNDNIWLGYFNEGIQVINSEKMEVMAEYNIYNGLPSMEVNYMACDVNNNILACFHNGLAVYNSTINEWQIINTIDGLRTDYLDVGVFAFPNGQIVLDQKGKFLNFSSDSIWLKPDSIITHISSIKVNGAIYKAGVLPDYIQKISLPYNIKEVQIEFSATDWNFPFRTKYFYRVDGIHEEGKWIPKEDAMINLAGLAPGSYTFRFYAITNDGIKTAERNLLIEITPPFYRTWWFIALSIILFGTLLYGLYKYRINQLKRLHEMRNSISRNLHDDIGASLSNIGILNELAKRNAGNKEKLDEYLSKAGDDIQHTSESLGDIVWNINPQYDDLNNLLVRMKRYAADMLDGKNINGQFDFPDNETGGLLSMAQRRDLYLIFKEAVNNLVKYSQARNAIIQITTGPHKISLLVKDDGKGFDRNNTRMGNGLHNMEQRAKASGGDILITSKPGEGTLVKLEMKIS